MWSVFFVLLSYLDRNVVKGALDTEKESEPTFSMIDGTFFCAKMSTVGENFLYQVSDGAEVVRSVIGPAGRLVNCALTVNHTQVKTFMQECMLGLREQGAGGPQPDARFTRPDEARKMCREFIERSKTEAGEEDSEAQGKVVKRSKRGFTYPGTLWCGAGDMADSYDQLGRFADTDSCCRTHDHCPHVIHAFSSNYGYTNFKWHSICHCDCDNALKACLRQVNDSSSRVVGQAFFNVIGVPCFELVYEEQCAERLWYGSCSKYENFPIAVLRDAVPYDFGGIKVIDELTVDPLSTRAAEKGSQEPKPESPTQSTILGSEAPSLRNVVTAAEDFIKVLATVSTSQSSTAESEKGEAQSSEKKKKKKKRKNKSKKRKNKKLKGKGKGRKRKLTTEAGVKQEEGAAISPSGGKAEEVKTLSNFISESHKHDQSRRDADRVGDHEYELQGKDEPSNEVMKDEPAKDEEATPTESPTNVQKSLAESDPQVPPEEEETPPFITVMTVTPHPAGNRRQIKGRRKKSKEISPSPPLSPPSPPPLEELAVTTTDHNRQPVFTSAAQSITDTQLVVSAATSTQVIPKVKINRLKEGGDSKRRKKRRKSSCASPAVVVVSAPQNSSEDDLPPFPLTGAPTVPPAPFTQRQLSRSPDVYRGESQVTAPNGSFSLSKEQRSKEKGQRKSRRKDLVSSLSINPRFYFQVAENASPTPDTHIASSRPETTVGSPSERRLFTTVSTKAERHAARRRTKPGGKKSAIEAPSEAASARTQTKPVTFTAKPFTVGTTVQRRSENPPMTISAGPTMSPRQWTVEKVKAQFARKKKRKAALLNRQH